VAEIAWCINIFHLTLPTSLPYIVKLRCSKVLFATNYLTTELAHSKLKNMVYLAELLVVMTDRLDVVRTLAQNGNKRYTSTHLSRLFLAPGKRLCCVFDVLGHRSC